MASVHKRIKVLREWLNEMKRLGYKPPVKVKRDLYAGEEILIKRRY